MNTIYFYKKRVEKKMENITTLTALNVVIAIGLSYLLLPATGIIGAGIAKLTDSSVVTLIILGESQRRRIQKQAGLSRRE